jgi:hypothetical protein
MSFLQSIGNALGRITGSKLSTPPAYNKKEPLRHQVRNWTFRIEITMKLWRQAVNIASAPMRPRREELYRMYETAMEDEHLLAQVRTARFTVQLAPFKIMRKTKEEKDLKKQLFDTPWFNQYMQYAVDSEIYGHSLVEVSEKDSNGHISRIHLMYREHVRPWLGIVVLDIGAEVGIPYRELPLANQMIEIGDPDDLGLLKTLSKLVIRKDNNIVDWGRRNERFGMPLIVVKTASRDEKELDKKEEFLKNFGSSGYAILDDQDEVELKEPVSNTGGGHITYKDFAERIDEKISQLVNGQTGTMNEKAFVGSAEVHERILNKYTKARLLRIQNHINFELIPWLVEYHEYPLDGCELKFDDLEEIPLAMTEGPKPGKPGEQTDPQDQKKKPAAS